MKFGNESSFINTDLTIVVCYYNLAVRNDTLQGKSENAQIRF